MKNFDVKILHLTLPIVFWEQQNCLKVHKNDIFIAILLDMYSYYGISGTLKNYAWLG